MKRKELEKKLRKAGCYLKRDEQGQLALDSPLTIDKKSRVEVIVLIPEDTEPEEDNQSKEAILEDFRQAWQEAMNGETIPIAQLWKGLV